MTANNVTRSIFLIKENNTSTFCASSKFKHFKSFDKAAIFLTYEHAVKAMKQMLKSEYKRWMYGGIGCSADSIEALSLEVPFVEMDLEVVECTVAIAD